MATNLLISEKRNTALPFAKYLGITDKSNVKFMKDGNVGYMEGTHNGDTWIVTWCAGHLVQTCMMDEYDDRYKRWNLNDLPFFPHPWKYKPASEKVSAKAQFNVIKDLLTKRKIDMVYHAADSDREGELIVRELLRECHAENIPAKRVWYSTITDSAIAKAMDDAKPLSSYDNLGAAAQLRQNMDWIYGINLTRAYTDYYHTTMNVGRVVSATIRLIVDRNNEIENFVPEKYGVVTAHLVDNDKEFDAKAKYSDLDKANEIKTRIKGKNGTITSVESKDAHTNRLLYDMTQLQADANKLFGYEPKETMAICQSLYEAGYMTYPRTDSNTITPDDRDETEPLLALATKEIFANPKQYNSAELDIDRIVKSVDKDDMEESHPGLCPTRNGIDSYQSKIKGNDKQRNIFLLITQRLICSCLPDNVAEKTKVTADITGEIFTANGSIERTPGFLPFEKYVLGAIGKKKRKSTADTILPPLVVGDVYTVTKSSMQSKETKPPKQYTTATLLEVMRDITRVLDDKELKGIMKSQKAGLGTKSSRDTIIDTIKRRGYVDMKGGYMIPTDKAKRLIDTLPEWIKSPSLTAKMEQSLDMVAKGKLDADKVENRVKQMVDEDIKRLKGMPAIPDTARFADAKVLIKGGCPVCGGDIGDTKKSFVCKDGCGFTIWKNITKKRITQAEAKSLCSTGKSTSKLDGFVSKKGSNFSCWLYVKADGSIGFDFSDDGREATSDNLVNLRKSQSK